MQIKKLIYFIVIATLLCSCSEDNDVIVPRNLQEYIDQINNLDVEDVIACAANADGNTNLTYIFYYPEIGATDIRIYETEDATVDENDFTIYKRKSYTNEAIFGGKLERFSRSLTTESWCIVTYLFDGKLRTSNPIRLKNNTKPTEWTDEVVVDGTQTLQPKFTWNDGTYTGTRIYFQVISDDEDDFISGTYTEEKTFQFYDLTNVVLNINTETPEDLTLDATYNFTMMGVSEDNWVNLVIEKPFVVE